MTMTKPFVALMLAALVATLAASTSSAQTPAPPASPSPAPAAAPAPKASPLPVVKPVVAPAPAPPVPVDRDLDDEADMDLDEPFEDCDGPACGVELDEAQLAKTIEQATADAMREVDAAKRHLEANRGTMEREARAAAKAMAMTDEARAKIFGETRAAFEKSMEANHAARAAAMRESMGDLDQEQTEAQKDRAKEAQREARERAREAEQDRRERERDKLEAAREKQQEEAERIDDLYDDAMDAIDEEDWGQALRPLGRLIALKSRVDAALYWTSYAQAKEGDSGSAMASLARLTKEFPASRWTKEGRALEMEIRGRSGQPTRPDQVDKEDDLDLKLMAISALAQSDAAEAMPVLTKILSSPTSSRKIRERSLFVLAQMGTEQSGNAIAEVARGNSSPELQRKAIQYLGVFGGAGNRKVLSDIYASSTDNTIRKQILNSFMVSGDKARVLSAARTEKDPTLRSEAVRLLGVMGGGLELSQMYQTATSTEEKKNILQALFIGGAVEPVLNAARGEKDKEARLTAIRNLGLMGGKTQGALGDLYKTETDGECKEQILNALFLQNNPLKLIEIARAEKDPAMKKQAVHWLSLMNSKESRAYMMELLKD